jgi:YHS domain-containing protein
MALKSFRIMLTNTLTLLVLLIGANHRGLAGIDPVNKDRKGAGLRGYDPVAYFTEGRPVRGNASYTTTWNGATWFFSSKANKDLFVEEPERYAPQYGGYCAYAVGNNYTADGDPTAWSIEQGKLYVNYNKNVRELWLKDTSNLIQKGDANWPKLLQKK